MKYTVKIKGWRVGAEKISLINKLTKEAKIPPSKAKEIKDKVVDYNEQVEVVIVSDKSAEIIVAEFFAIGFIVEVNPL